jgi:DNA-binding NarL/FixJ family response regulator
MCAVSVKPVGSEATGSRKSMPLRRLRILIADDCPLISEGLAGVFRREPNLEVCGFADNRIHALNLVEELLPDAVVMGLAIGNFEGFDLIKDLRMRFPRLKILVVSMCDENINACRSIQAGANGFIHKKSPVAEIVAAIQKVSHGDVYLSPRIRAQVFSKFARSPDAELVAPVDLLTDRELQILELIGDGISRSEIAERLCLHVNTVETYRARIKLKLQLKDANDLLQYAIQSKHGKHGAPYSDAINANRVEA